MPTPFAIVNLLDGVANSVGDGFPGVEGHFGRRHLDSEHLGVSFFRYAPGVRATLAHHHREQEEAYVVVGGSGRMRLDDDIVDVQGWDVVRVAPDVVRGVEGGPAGLEIIAIGADRPADGDGELVRDWGTG